MERRGDSAIVFTPNLKQIRAELGARDRALLFPMERVFESYVAQQLRRALADHGWEVTEQDREYFLFDEPSKFALRPDVVVTRSDGSRVVLDTKWKRLVDNPQGQLRHIPGQHIPDVRVRQEARHAGGVAALSHMPGDVRRCWNPFLCNDGVSVRLFFVDVARIERSMAGLRVALRAPRTEPAPR